MNTISGFRAAAAALSICALTALPGCFDSGAGGKSADFDREGLLVNVADRLIVPAYARLADGTAALHAAVEALVDAPDSGKVEDARNALKAAWLAWQGASAYELGPAADHILRQRFNTFPTNAAKVEARVKEGTWNLESVANFEAKGFPALDWLLNGRAGATDSLLALLGDTATGGARGRYLLDVAKEIADRAAAVHAAWTEGEKPYRDEFVSRRRQGTDIGSSLGELVNQFNYDYEILKNPRIGIPLGKKTLGQPLPGKVEGYYGGYSLELARAQVRALEDLFLGRDSLGADGQGFDDYLDALGTRYRDGELAQLIKDRFAAVRAALEAVPDPLSRAIVEEKDEVEKAYDEIQRMVVFIKTEMPSAMSISITYQDGDGD
jgi:predicted lipoprotein